MMIEQTIEIPMDRRITIEIPPEVPVGKVILTFTPAVDRVLEEAEKIWDWNRAHPGELKAKLLKLRGSLSSGSFGGMDGVSYQRKIRDEWDTD
ncbi:MAG: hypothetical protein LBK83_06210 [Treponema sp.]|jgi:hypothetical protein|nr:hypothetical protein [Treponema sp.]